MSKRGQYSFVIGKEIDRSINFAKNIAMGMYSGKYCKKPQRIHLVIHDLYNAPHVRMGNTRCTCGGYTFSTLTGCNKVVCRHCGKVFTQRAFDELPHQELTRVEKENRHIFSMLIAGGDLREDKERDVLILKDRLGIPEGDLPLSYAEYFANTFHDAQVIKTTLAANKADRIALAQAQLLSI